jgi:demethylmenaquinone methyltransferase/2-methoxy-6-polyprenyl-1,4-benzoquinol methylase
MVLEFSQIPNALMQRAYDLYSFNVIPVMGQIVAGTATVINILWNRSANSRPGAFAALIRQAGFANVKYRNLTMGIAALHTGWKI